MVQRTIRINVVGGFSYYNANKKKLINAVSQELEGFRKPKQAQMKGNIVKMVQELKYICIDGVDGFYQLVVKQIAQSRVSLFTVTI